MPGQRAEEDASGFADDSCPCNAYARRSVARDPRTSERRTEVATTGTNATGLSFI
jgi:hypothetical protein